MTRGSQGSGPGGFIQVNGTILFTADVVITTGSGHHQTTTYLGRELWRTNGTAAGTVLVKDINPGFESSGPSDFAVVNNTLFFSAHTPDLGTEIWKSDGTGAGTVLLKDINPTFRGSYPSSLREFHGRLFFNANDLDNGTQLWRSDGTTAGTVIASDFAPGFTGTILADFVPLGCLTFFTGFGATGGLEQWRTDGTAAGTVFLKQIFTAEDLQGELLPMVKVAAGGLYYFTALDPAVGMELFVSEGKSTRLVRDIFPGRLPFDPAPMELVAVGNRVFFTADDGTHGRELWMSDGTLDGTRMVLDLFP
jgi:ELWxxDGT repeat protein